MSDEPAGAAAGKTKRHRKLIAALLAVHLLVALSTMAVMADIPRGDFVLLLIVSLATSQGSLVAVWAAFGGRATPWRLLAATIAVLGWLWLWERGFPESDVKYWSYFVLAQTLGTSVPLVALRFCGLGVARPRPDDSVAEMQKLQFSLRALLEWTTALAALMSMVQMTPEELREPFTSPDEVLEFCVLFGGDALLALAALWIALGVRWTVARLIMLALAGAGAVVGMTMFERAPTSGRILAFPLLCALWLVGSLWVVRLAGYRLVWRGTARI